MKRDYVNLAEKLMAKDDHEPEKEGSFFDLIACDFKVEREALNNIPRERWNAVLEELEEVALNQVRDKVGDLLVYGTLIGTLSIRDELKKAIGDLLNEYLGKQEK